MILVLYEYEIGRESYFLSENAHIYEPFVFVVV